MVHIPWVRGAPETYTWPAASTGRYPLMTFLRGNSDVLQRLAVKMYARGLSTRDIEIALEEATTDCLLSHTAVSQVTEVVWEEHEAFAERDFSVFEVEFLFLDAVYESPHCPAVSTGGSEAAARTGCCPHGPSASMGAR